MDPTDQFFLDLWNIPGLTPEHRDAVADLLTAAYEKGHNDCEELLEPLLKASPWTRHPEVPF